ncbi:MAG: hypothetical protein ACKO4R_02350 [Synechococcales cyanobacterium]
MMTHPNLKMRETGRDNADGFARGSHLPQSSLTMIPLNKVGIVLSHVLSHR